MFKRIPNFPKYEISKSGQVRKYLCKTRVKVYTARQNHAVAFLSNEDGAGMFSVPELMLHSFVGGPPKYKPNVVALDGNFQNLQLANFTWGRRRFAPTKGKITQHDKPHLKCSADEVGRGSIRDRYFVDEDGVIWLRFGNSNANTKMRFGSRR